MKVNDVKRVRCFKRKGGGGNQLPHFLFSKFTHRKLFFDALHRPLGFEIKSLGMYLYEGRLTFNTNYAKNKSIFFKCNNKLNT